LRCGLVASDSGPRRHERCVSQERREQKALHGVGVMFVHVIGMPLVDQLVEVEAMILDIPSLMAETDGPLGGNLRGRKRGHPDRVAGLRRILSVDLPAHRVRFQRTEDAHGSVHLGPGEQVWKIPPQALAGPVGTFLRR
jgi:hypothetical protein